MEIVARKGPPTGVARLLFRLPVHVYRLGLGRLFGSRLMLLTHRGRKTGRQRQAVIEVVGGDATTGYLACSGFGRGAAWYRNVLAEPHVTIQVGNRRLPVRAEPLTEEQGAEAMAAYARRHPRAARKLCRLLGFAVDGSAADYREVGRHLPFVRFVPGP